MNAVPEERQTAKRVRDGGPGTANAANDSAAEDQDGNGDARTDGNVGGTCGMVPADAHPLGCGGEDLSRDDLPLDLFFMLDQSTSMNTILSDGRTRWEHVTAALPLYLMSGLPAGSRAGLQYFGLGGMTGCSMSADGGPPDWSQCAACNVAQYAAADVPIEPLDMAAPHMTSSIAGHGPSTFTPTAAAVEGGLDFASSWAAQHTDHRTVFVLVTDGFPTQCAVQDIGGIAQLVASAAKGSPSVKTVVVAVGEADANLNTLAVAGGSTAAILVPDVSADVTTAIVNGLSQRITTTSGCSYPLPKNGEAGTFQPKDVNVLFTRRRAGTRKCSALSTAVINACRAAAGGTTTMPATRSRSSFARARASASSGARSESSWGARSFPLPP